MNTPQDEWPAFPHTQRLWDNDAQSRAMQSRAVHSVGGMTLRDYFAAAALQGMWARESMSNVHHNGMAEAAYRSADAMLAERAKGGAA